MRIFVKIQPESGSEGKFPADYRRIFMSLLKQAYECTPFEEIVNSHDRIPKPYVFSVGFNRIKEISGDSIIFESPVFFNFSSSIPQMVGYLYNYIISQTSIVNGSKVAGVNLPVPKVITSKTVTFKIMGSAVLTRSETERYYVSPEDDDFEEALNYSLQVRLNLLKGFFEKFSVKVPDFKPVRVVNKNLKKVPVKHYGGYIEAFSGTITLDGSPDILNFLYENGMGVRTGQGFGMLKVVKEWR
ncbi:CRISPR-associated endoribonuclease Cas6 [Thermotoga sp.]|uniref:CRISPR-associated endoribonuclease Cas6 n=1 Tax=Thermotoga sp. TaxID=28240 RepID=UPI0025CF7978|nr:CRISPR-associated endoribonuclease Cas6 [Thermotoga sp.]MCD6552067.1 CRISPR-associated endoribonuclease Cas6 [Thermotoga sp.]